jgi:hypothetical protein
MTPGTTPSQARSAQSFTHVELIWVEKSVEHWIRFGMAVREEILDRRRRLLSFRPGSSFALVRWAANEHGTIESRLDILCAPRAGEAYQTVPLVDPGGVLLLRARGWPKVERMLQIIDAIEAAGIDAVEVSPDHWRHVHNRLAAGERPRPYSPAQHRAWLKRRSVQS